MDIKCPHCGTEYEVEPHEVGRTVTCQLCGKGFVIKSLRAPHSQHMRERTILAIKPSMAPFVLINLMLIPLYLLLGFILGAVLGFDNNALGGVTFIFMIILWFLVFFIVYLVYNHIEYIITNRRVIIKDGIITKSERQVHVQDMRDIFLHRGLFNRMTGTGSISIGSQTTGILARVIIRDCKEYQSIISTFEALKR